MKAAPQGTARRDEIVAAAARLFDERGYHTTSMDDIAAAVGIKKPTLYHHVQSKTQIVIWIHDELVHDLTDRLEQRVADKLPRAEILLRIMDDILGLLETRPGHLRVYFEHHREIPGEEGRVAREMRDRYTETVRKIIEEGAAAGEFRVENPGLTTFAFFGMCNWAYQWYRPGGRLTHQSIARYFWQIFMTGIATGPEVLEGHAASLDA
ncbi:MAG: TetR family transcriptional regulator [Pseudonocardia sp.]|uniref:TetR/AcrR family transcriptional regulator n=1 Tax=unclassified Pseudonocardia TaxID=2619320 RepID=UPI000868E723|nr:MULTISPECIES: TetR/AcrR family transcriptional regulator [unclassified Pseudonocardia]MBN9110368.1 TetR family transcriptional regulator [Pseudonocardia sp.]ODV03873.1 MAG: TetR family transcriptional regulator [Pseudonocardia sp. SCN 73-27]RTL66273.1 MAG: TetR/AcrR family transcriptional regulator [Pseudonocardiaceae bacterium]